MTAITGTMLDTERAHTGTVRGMQETTPARKLLKPRVKPELYDQVAAYAERTHRSLASAAEYLIARGLAAEGHGQEPGEPGPTTHLR